MFEMFQFDWNNPTLLLIITGLIVVPLSGLLNNEYNKRKAKKGNLKVEIDKKINLIDGILSKEDQSKTSDKISKVSMDNFKTKEDHPMGDKTHD